MNSQKIKRIKRILICIFVALVLLFIDQITKIVAQITLSEGTRPLIKGWLEFTYVLNDSVAFGIGNGNTAFITVIMVLTPILSAVFIALALTLFKKNLPAALSLFVIASGALGNFLDRLFIVDAAGKAVVRDFMYIRFFNVCNFADFCITLGAVALIFILLFIGPSAAFPLKKSWREEQKRQDEEKKKKKYGEA